jgi:hypothetical protein
MPDNLSHIQIIDQLEEATDKFLSGLEKSFPGASDQIFDEVSDLVRELKRRSNGNLTTSVENLKLIDKFRVQINKAVQNSKYGTAVYDFIKGYESNTAIINDYFSSIVVDFSDNDKLLKEILDVNIQTTVDSLLGSGINANFTQPIIKALKDHVRTGSNRIEVVQVIKDLIYGTSGGNGRLVNYAGQAAADAITQFNSHYLDDISADLGLNHYFYKGTKVKDSRSLCIRMAGKYFTEKEMKAIIESEIAKGGWGGMIPGTNWDNFGTYRGGYRCRHYRIPISKEIYEAFKN